jgi:Carboxypeptidase regulatory-like domain
VAELRAKHLRRYHVGMSFTRLRALALILFTIGAMACRTGVPVVDTGPKPPTRDGTIAGHVSSTGGAAVVGRIVRAISIESGQKYETSTNNAGTYTLKVPPGRYRLEVELRSGEKLSKEPGETKIDNSDLDPNRDFVIAPGQ